MKRLFVNSALVASSMCVGDLATTFLGFSVGGVEGNPLSAFMPLYIFFLLGLAVQIVCTFIVSYCFDKAIAQPKVGLIAASIPRTLAIISNLTLYYSIVRGQK